MKAHDLTPTRLVDGMADAVGRSAEQGALEAHLAALAERAAQLQRRGAGAREQAELQLQMARTLVSLNRGDEAWPLGRAALDVFIAEHDFESAADCCDVLFRADQAESLCALGQGIWLAVTYPIDPELSFELLSHIVEETPAHADGAAVAATVALFLADLRATGAQRDNLMFFASRLLAEVARRHSGIDSQEAFDRWREQLELHDPERFLRRLRQIIDVLVQDRWWFDRAALQARLPIN